MEKNIVLIGMPGCGKSTLGKKLAERLGIDFVDLDEYIEKKEGLTIPEIFELGEEYFRNLEKKAVKEVVQTCPQVIATGGGVVLNPDNMEMLRKNGLIFFINRAIDIIASEIEVSRRPLLAKDRKQIFRLYEQRRELYKKYSDYEIINNESMDQAIDEIVRIVKAEGGRR